MERKKKPRDDERIRWRKIGGGSLVLGKRFIKPNQVFLARPDEIPKGFLDCIKPLEDLPEEKPVKSITAYEIRSLGSGALDGYAVCNKATGKCMSEGVLTRTQADQLLGSLS